METSSSAIIKNKQVLENDEALCEGWLLPEVSGTTFIKGKSAQAISKSLGADQEEDLENNESAEIQPSVFESLNKTTQKAQSPTSPTNSTEPSLASAKEKLSDSETLVPERLSDFDEAMTLKKLKQYIAELEEQVSSSAHNTGYEKGYQLGLNESKKQYEADIVNVTAIFDGLNAQLSGLLNDQQETLQSALHAIILQMVQGLTTVTFKENPAGLQDLLDEALAQYPTQQEKPTVRINPQDYELLEKHSLLKDGCEWHQDESVTQGGFFVSGCYADIDHSYETRLQQIVDQYFTQ